MRPKSSPSKFAFGAGAIFGSIAFVSGLISGLLVSWSVWPVVFAFLGGLFVALAVGIAWYVFLKFISPNRLW